MSLLGPERSATDAAVEAVRRLGPQASNAATLIYAHASIDEELSLPPATQIGRQAGLPDILAFSVSQAGFCAAFAGLWLARALLAEASADPKPILLVTADKWLPPFVRSFGALGAFGDAAGAILLTADDDDAECEVLHVAFRPGHGGDLHDPAGSFGPEAVLAGLAEVFAETLACRGLSPGDLGGVIAPSNFESLPWAGAVAELLPGAPRPWGPSPPTGHLSSSDPIAGIAAWLAAGRPPGGDPVLLWNYGPGGQAGAALLASRRES